MDLLLDTHAVIWFITDDEKLPAEARTLIENIENKCFVSIASYWEIGIKHALKRLELNTDLETIFKIIEETGFVLLPVTPAHILANARLDFHHQDPFDRIIIAQAKVENLTVVSKDAQFDKYSIPLLWDK